MYFCILSFFCRDATEIFALVENIRDVSLCAELAFMAKYKELCELQAELRALQHPTAGNDDEKAPVLTDAERYFRTRSTERAIVEIVVSLLVFNVAPRKFWLPILWDVAPILERTPAGGGSAGGGGSVPLLTCADVHSLLECMEQLKLSHHRVAYARSYTEAQQNAIRFALAKQLSAAILSETSGFGAPEVSAAVTT